MYMLLWHLVSILNPQYQAALVGSGEQKVEESRSGASQMEQSGGTGSESYSYAAIHSVIGTSHVRVGKPRAALGNGRQSKPAQRASNTNCVCLCTVIMQCK